MRKISIFVLGLLSLIPAYAVNYCASSSWGYCDAVTGGGNASPTLVKSESELKTALKSNNKVIVITQDITLNGQISSDKSNITLTALPGAKLICTNQTKEGSGILYLKGSNIILRNLIFDGPGAFDCDGKDNLTLDGARKIWVDHCDFRDGCDGNFDIKGLSDNISITWCRFRYLKAPKPKEAGDTNPDHTDDHRFSNLVGSSSSDKPLDGKYSITYAYCWWDNGCKQRMTRCRNCELHFLNCYWNSSVADYYIGPENAACYFEGCTFAGKANSAKNIYKAFNNTTNYCKFVNCAGNLPADKGDVAAPNYAYDKLSAAEAKAFVTNACGSGATLTVNEAAVIYSACDSGETPPEPKPEDPDPVDPQPGEQIAVSGECCVNLGLGEEPTVANKGIPEDFSKLSILVNLEKGKWDIGCLNMGGNADYITFDFSAYSTAIVSVEFDVTIPLWTEEKNTVAYHWNDNENARYTIKSAAKEVVRLTAPENAKSFTIQRSASTGTRISKVCFQFSEGDSSQEGLEDIYAGNAARKVLQKGQILIIRNGKSYNLLGFNQ